MLLPIMDSPIGFRCNDLIKGAYNFLKGVCIIQNGH